MPQKLSPEMLEALIALRQMMASGTGRSRRRRNPNYEQTYGSLLGALPTKATPTQTYPQPTAEYLRGRGQVAGENWKRMSLRDGDSGGYWQGEALSQGMPLAGGAGSVPNLWETNELERRRFGDTPEIGQMQDARNAAAAAAQAASSAQRQALMDRLGYSWDPQKSPYVGKAHDVVAGWSDADAELELMNIDPRFKIAPRVADNYEDRSIADIQDDYKLRQALRNQYMLDWQSPNKRPPAEPDQGIAPGEWSDQPWITEGSAVAPNRGRYPIQNGGGVAYGRFRDAAPYGLFNPKDWEGWRPSWDE